MSRTPSTKSKGLSILVTGGNGYIGNKLLQALTQEKNSISTLVSVDLKMPAKEVPGVIYAQADISKNDLSPLLKQHKVDAVVHLAAIVSPKGGEHARLEYEVDVLGTENVLQACLAEGVKQFVVTSSGAAYGYHKDNSPLLQETDPIRGNDEFPYSKHKRLVEEMLARYRTEHPKLKQLIFRPGTVMGKGVKNQITAIFEGPFVLGLADAASPFVFIWDEDVVAAIKKGLLEQAEGIYNLAGDGVMTLREIANELNKPFLAVPSKAMEEVLRLAKPLGLLPWGPEQVRFLKYRPVLSNEKLKRDFHFVPRKTSREVFHLYQKGT